MRRLRGMSLVVALVVVGGVAAWASQSTSAPSGSLSSADAHTSASAEPTPGPTTPPVATTSSSASASVSPTTDPSVEPGAPLTKGGRHRMALLRLPGAQDLPPEAKNARVSGPVTIVQANLYTGMSAAAFDSDLATVVASQPDVVTLSEAYRRTPAQLRPAGYDEYRAEGPRDARETPVLWRTDRWKRVDSGTYLMHDRPVKWGTRYVNWVTLEELGSGARLSVISAHASPGGVGRDGLLETFLARLDLLAGELADRGPVLIGSDLNVYYQRADFLRTSFPRTGAVSTFDSLGEPLGGWATGDGGRTIDYIFSIGALPQRHSTTPLANSDHLMLAATVELLPDL